MALNLRATIEGSDVNGANAEARIYLNGFAGTAVTRQSIGDFFEIQSGDENSELLPTIYGSQATITFKADNDYEFTDLFASNSRDVYIEIELTDTNTLLFCGFIEPNKWNEPLISAPYEVKISAYDGLGLLTEEDFRNADKTPIEGELTILQILATVLQKTGLQLPINTATNIRPSGESTAADPLTQYKIDVKIYQNSSCYDVLTQLFKACRIWQRNGQWYVVANNLLSAANVSTYIYTYAGVANGTGSFNPRLSSYTIEDQAELSLVGGLKQWTIKQNYGYVDNVLNNADFSEFDGDNFDNWTAVNIDPEQRNLNADGDKFIYIPGTETDVPWQESTRTRYMKSDGMRVIQSSELFNAKIKFALMGPKKSSGYVFFGAYITGDNGTNYTLEAYLDETDGTHIAYRWVEATHPYPISVKSYIDYARWAQIGASDQIKAEKISAYPWNEIADHFEEVSINPQGGIPTTGYMSFYLFAAQPSTGSTVLAGACFDVVSLFLTDEDATEFATSKEITLINSLNNNFVPDDIELINGDTPPISNQLLIYDGQFINAATDNATSLWTADGITGTYNYVELTARLLAAEIAKSKQTYKVKLAEVALQQAIVFEDTANYNNGKYLFETGITYNFRMATVEGSFTELLEPNLGAFTLVETVEINQQAGSRSTGSSKTNPTFTTDEKVKLITPDTFDIIGQAGYLSAQYFGQLIDETTGRALIFPRNPFTDDEGTQSETPIVPPNGTTTDFTLSTTPNPYSVQVYLNGIRQQYNVDYTLSVRTISFTTAPQTGDIIKVFFNVYSGEIKTWNEVPTGTINGTNTTFTLAAEAGPGTLNLYLNGILQTEGTDYSLSGNTITFTIAPYSGDSLLADYKTTAASNAGTFNVTPTGTINGVNTIFSLTVSPTSAKIYLNGIRQILGTDYTISGTDITFTTAPQTGDWIIVDYI